MKRLTCLGALALVGVVSMVATQKAWQERSTLVVTEVAENLYMLGNEPGGQGMRGGGNTGIFVGSTGVTLVEGRAWGRRG